jgi:hypothetical protein
MEELVHLHIDICKWEGEYEVYWNDESEGSFNTLKEAKEQVAWILAGYLDSLNSEIVSELKLDNEI